MAKQKEVAPENTKLKNLLQDLQKQHKGAVISMGNEIEQRARISSGSKEIDELIGGGFPCGLYSTIWGSKSCGKTSLCYSSIAEAQKLGKTCLYLDLERSYDPERAKTFGVDIDALIVAEFAKAEMTMDTIITLCKEKAVGLIVLDSIQSMSPTGENEDKKGKEFSVEHDTQALLARKLGQFFRMSAHYVSTSQCAVLLIGQSRISLGFISVEMLTGGNALLHWSSLILKLRRGKGVDAPMDSKKEYYTDENGKDRYKTVKTASGFNLVVKMDKTKVASKREATELQIPFYFDSGFTKIDVVEKITKGDKDGDSKNAEEVGK